VELGAHNIQVNAISPGYFATEYNQALAEDPFVADMIQRRVPMKRWGSPVEIVGPAIFLASDAGSYVNGQTIVVDGGMTIAG
jgi:gluconate 5-dehydrogenase